MAVGAIGALFPDAATTGDVTVRVSASYLPEQSEPARGRWFWAYHIRIENDGAGAVSAKRGIATSNSEPSCAIIR